MRDVQEIQSKFPTLWHILGEEYVESLKSEQGALAKRATINPFFAILYEPNNTRASEMLEQCFKSALENNSISVDRLKRFRVDKQHANIQNFINEVSTLSPVFDAGYFLDESNEGATPDFIAEINGTNIVFECVSVNEAGDTIKEKNKNILDSVKQHKAWKRDNPEGGVFTVVREHHPYGTHRIENIIEKIRNKKSSRQVKDFEFKVLVMSFRNMLFADSRECLPNTSNYVDGIHSGIIYHAFYGKQGDLIFLGNSFEGERHQISILESDGKFRRPSEYNLCILHFDTDENETIKKYIFFENFGNPMPIEYLNKLCDAFSPYESHSILKKYVAT
ncbi:MAG: hypothetical protein WC236_06535 [Gallionellaceae bacterium]|jgi:hypothetical protein